MFVDECNKRNEKRMHASFLSLSVNRPFFEAQLVQRGLRQRRSQLEINLSSYNKHGLGRPSSKSHSINSTERLAG